MPGAVLAACAAVLLAVMAGCSGTGQASASASASRTPSPGHSVVARVNGVGVTSADVDALLAEARLGGRTIDRAQALDRAVRRVLVQREATRLGVSVDDATVSAALATLAKRSGGDAALGAALSAAGLTRARLKVAVASGLVEARLADALFPGVRAGDAAALGFYTRNRDALFTSLAQIRLGQITLPGKLLAEKIAARLARGAPFAATARRFSMDTETRSAGGDLGWVSVASLPPEIRAALAGVRPGRVSDPVRSFGRWQLFKIFARRPASVTPYAAVAKTIRDELTRRQRAAALDAWLRRARARAGVEVLP